MDRCDKFLKDQDDLGEGVRLTFNGKGVYQTKVGGFCSLFWNLVFVFYCSLLTWGLIFEPYAIWRQKIYFADIHFYGPSPEAAIEAELPTGSIMAFDYTGFPVLQLVKGPN